jgi:hypothetical protein
MRAQAARCMPNFDADKAGPLLLEVARGDGFDKLPESERKAIVSSIVLVHDKSCETFVRESLEQKSGFLAKKRVDDMKLLLIESLELVPSIPAVQLLADIAKDKSKHSKEVAETALSTALRMRQKLLGA